MSDDCKETQEAIVKQPEKWSTDSWKIRAFGWKNIIWMISTIFMCIVILVPMFFSHAVVALIIQIIIVGGWILFSIILILHKAFEKSVGNTKVEVKLEAGAKLNAEADKLASVLTTAINKGGEGK